MSDARQHIPPGIRERLPARGIYAAGGGLTSAAWRVIVDFDARTLARSSGPRNGSTLGAMADTVVEPLEPSALAALRDASGQAFSEKAQLPAQPSVDYEELLVLADGQSVRLINGFGPIRSPKAAALIALLRKR